MILVLKDKRQFRVDEEKAREIIDHLLKGVITYDTIGPVEGQ